MLPSFLFVHKKDRPCSLNNANLRGCLTSRIVLHLVPVNVKWGKQKLEKLELDLSETPTVFKSQLYSLTGTKILSLSHMKTNSPLSPFSPPSLSPSSPHPPSLSLSSFPSLPPSSKGVPLERQKLMIGGLKVGDDRWDNMKVNVTYGWLIGISTLNLPYYRRASLQTNSYFCEWLDFRIELLRCCLGDSEKHHKIPNLSVNPFSFLYLRG